MDKLPFTVYDFFAYLASGFITLVAITASFVGYQPLKAEPGFILAVFFVVCAYVTGQVVANISGDLIERRLVRDRLGMPSKRLMGAPSTSRVRRLLPGYFKALPDETIERIRERASERDFDGTEEALFLHCHATMKSDATVQVRLDTFLNLYGFCRNMTLALVIAATTLVIGVVAGSVDTGPDLDPGWWIAAALLAAIGTFYRYLKFLRQYSFELFTSYAETKP